MFSWFNLNAILALTLLKPCYSHWGNLGVTRWLKRTVILLLPTPNITLPFAVILPWLAGLFYVQTLTKVNIQLPSFSHNNDRLCKVFNLIFDHVRPSINTSINSLISLAVAIRCFLARVRVLLT